MSILYLKYIGHVCHCPIKHYDNKEDAVCKVEVSIPTGPLDKYHKT